MPQRPQIFVNLIPLERINNSDYFLISYCLLDIISWKSYRNHVNRCYSPQFSVEEIEKRSKCL